MSIIATVRTRDDGYIVAEWESLAQGETGNFVLLGASPGLKTYQLDGTFGGASFALEGSLDGTTYYTLSTIELSAGIYVLIAGITTPQMASIIENPLFIKPIISGGNGTTALKLSIGVSGKSK